MPADGAPDRGPDATGATLIRMRGSMRSIVVLVVLALAIAACSSDESEDTSTTTSSVDESGVEGGDTEPGGPSTTVPNDEMAISQMCRTLQLLNNAAVFPPPAAAAMQATDLMGATSQERAAYGDLLLLATQEECTYLTGYANEIAYWLGY